MASAELLNTSANPTMVDASIKPSMTSQIPSGAPGGEYQSRYIPKIKNREVIPIKNFLLPLISVIDPKTGLNKAIAIPDMV